MSRTEINDSVLESSAEELVALAVMWFKRNTDSQAELAREMKGMGFPVKRIAALLGTTPNTVSQALRASANSGNKTTKKKAKNG